MRRDHVSVIIQSVLQTLRNISSVLWSTGICASYLFCCCDKIPVKTKMHHRPCFWRMLSEVSTSIALALRRGRIQGHRSTWQRKLLTHGSKEAERYRASLKCQMSFSALVLSGCLAIFWTVSPIFRVGLPLSDTQK